MFSMKEFGQRVSNLRKVRNLTQDELAYRVNVKAELSVAQLLAP